MHDIDAHRVRPRARTTQEASRSCRPQRARSAAPRCARLLELESGFAQTFLGTGMRSWPRRARRGTRRSAPEDVVALSLGGQASNAEAPSPARYRGSSRRNRRAPRSARRAAPDRRFEPISKKRRRPLRCRPVSSRPAARRERDQRRGRIVDLARPADREAAAPVRRPARVEIRVRTFHSRRRCARPALDAKLVRNQRSSTAKRPAARRPAPSRDTRRVL